MFNDKKEMAKLGIKDVEEGTMLLNKHNNGLAAPMHPSQANMGDVILIARGKFPKQNLLYCVYENYPHQLYEITSIDQNIHNQVIKDGIKYFPKSGNVFAKMGKNEFDTLNKNLIECCNIKLTLPKSQPKKQMPTLPKYDFIYKSEKTGKIFKGTLTSNRLAVLEPVSSEDYAKYSQHLQTSKYAYLSVQNKNLIDNLLKNTYHRYTSDGTEYILNDQLMSEISHSKITNIVNYELDRMKNNNQHEK